VCYFGCREFIDALILMDDGKYTQAIESLRCIRWKAFHFLGPFLATCVDEKIADCFLRTGNYQTAINHFNRTLSLLGESGDRILPSLKYAHHARTTHTWLVAFMAVARGGAGP
jgi:hypothetical protein